MPRTVKAPPKRWQDVGELLKQFGNISPRRIRMDPLPGTATEKDLLRLLDHGNRLYELIDGVLVEKVMGLAEAHLALRLGGRMEAFAEEHDLGFVAGADGTLRLLKELVRIPDVAFISWRQLPDKRIPVQPIPHLVPNLAVEILSEGNTRGEMLRKLKEYFLAGVQLVWFVDPPNRCVTVYRSPEDALIINEDQLLDGGDVVPGFRLPLKQLFARMPAVSGKKTSRKRKKA
jgi:Uma2 family endonuclease